MDRAIGIITTNYETPDLKELINGRTAASVPYGGRYRMIDFSLSNMENADITTVGIITPYKYRSLIDHFGAGSEWNLDRKIGGLFVLPGSVFGISTKGSRFLLRDFRRNMVFLSRASAKYVVVTTANIVANLDYNKMIDQHEQSGADITLAYVDGVRDDNDISTIVTDESGKVKDILRGVKKGDKAFVDSFVISYELLLKVLDWYAAIDYLDLFEALAADFDKMDIRLFKVEGYLRSIYSAGNYFRNSMDLLRPEVSDELFRRDRPIATKITDAPPTKYGAECVVKNSLIPAGCIIEGTVENSILFRGVTVGKGAVVRNAIVMQSCKIGDGAVVENAIIDRSNKIEAGSVLKGTPENILIKEKNELGN
ncbi:MAG: glucose-1-phosphate adenylyltransferase subunit GlgD [Oscillospiraceae bacterium]|nr:glucose-1-phosphate adenylyltransferase subunit GlgD [Oscillospiraceae bacterium]